MEKETAAIGSNNGTEFANEKTAAASATPAALIREEKTKESAMDETKDNSIANVQQIKENHSNQPSQYDIKHSVA